MTTMQTKTQRQQRWDLATWLYNAALAIASPALVLWLAYRILVQGKSREGLRERLGQLPEEALALGRQEDPVIWFQAVSAGEVAVAEPVIQELRIRQPLAHIALSTTTKAGREMALKRQVNVDALFYFPFDLPVVVDRVLDGLRPAMLVLVEGEIWPNLIAAAKRRGIAVALINGRVSDKAFPRAKLVRPVYRWALGNVDLIAAQSQTNAERFIALGAPPERVKVLGNTKFDQKFPEVSAAEAAHLRNEFGFGEDDRVLVAGSTHPGEEEVVLEAFARLRPEFPDLQLVIAPRHIERADQVHELVESFGFQVYRRSHARNGQPQPQPAGPQARVVILDTIGELSRVYALATVVFVGGSIARIGGHNILEPLAQGKPVLVGPHMHNFREMVAVAQEYGVVEQVRTAEEMAQAVARYLREPARVAQVAQRAHEMMQREGGAVERIVEALSELLERSVAGG